MLPGKHYSPEEILHILTRRVWYLLVPFAIVSAATAVVGRRLPDKYRSEATLLVQPQQVNSSIVKSGSTTPIQERVASIHAQLLSRTRLERMITDLDLYAPQRKGGAIMEDVIGRMRNDVQVAPVKGDTFRVTYIGSDPRTVMKVADRLATVFIEEGLQDRSRMADGTSEFLETELDSARRKLQEQENKLKEYRLKYSGQLPSQAQSNLTALQNTQQQINTLNDQNDRDSTQVLAIRQSIENLQNAALFTATATLPTTPTPLPVGADPLQNMTLAQRIDAMKMQLTIDIAKNGWKDEYPYVVQTRRLIEKLEKQLQDENDKRPLSSVAAEVISPAERQRLDRLNQLQQQVNQLEENIKKRNQLEQQLRQQAAVYLAKVENVPIRESEMADLTRDYGNSSTMYQQLLSQKQNASIAANLERRQIGEQFTLLDRARLPERPFSPDRQLINLGGMAAGFGIGLVLIALLEYRDSSFKVDEEVTRVLSLPVLAVVPLMESEHEQRRGFKKRLFWNVGLGGTVLGCLAVLLYTFVRP